MKFFVVMFFVFSLFQLALFEYVENEDEFASGNKENISAETLLRAIDYVNNAFNENSFEGLSDGKQQLISFIIKNLSNDPGVMSSMEKIKDPIVVTGGISPPGINPIKSVNPTHVNVFSEDIDVCQRHIVSERFHLVCWGHILYQDGRVEVIKNGSQP